MLQRNMPKLLSLFLMMPVYGLMAADFPGDVRVKTIKNMKVIFVEQAGDQDSHAILIFKNNSLVYEYKFDRYVNIIDRINHGEYIALTDYQGSNRSDCIVISVTQKKTISFIESFQKEKSYLIADPTDHVYARCEKFLNAQEILVYLDFFREGVKGKIYRFNYLNGVVGKGAEK